MTALRVITEHNELSGSGSVTHPELDVFVSGSSFLVVSGSGPIPPNGRRLVAGSNVTIVDGGPGGNLTISAIGGGAATISWNEIPSGLNDGDNKTFTLANTPTPPQAVMFFINGIKQSAYPWGMDNDRDYRVDGNVVTVLVDYVSGSNIEATYPY